jgi:hypothetical protein
MKRYLNNKPWHKYIRRGVWISIVVLMLVDLFYYYLAIEHGRCAEDRKLVYPPPPASYVIAGPISREKLERVSAINVAQEKAKLDSWRQECNAQKLMTLTDCMDKKWATEIRLPLTQHWACENKISGVKGSCVVQNIIKKNIPKKLPFRFIRESSVLQDINGEKYYESYDHQPDGHWLSRLLFGYYGFNFMDYRGYSACAHGARTMETTITLDAGGE